MPCALSNKLFYKSDKIAKRHKSKDIKIVSSVKICNAYQKNQIQGHEAHICLAENFHAELTKNKIR